MRDDDKVSSRPMRQRDWDALFTDEVMDVAIAYWGLPGRGACTDPETLRAAAAIDLADKRRVAAEAQKAARPAAGPHT